MVTDTEHVAVCMPWRPQPHRLAAYERVRAWWDEAGFEVIEADSDPDRPFNLAAARNVGVSAATTDIVIIADADTIPDPGALRRAIRRARYKKVIYPFDRYVYLGEVDPADPRPLSEYTPEKVYTHSVGGLMVIRRDHYWELGGHDEGFERWGYEDTAFELTAQVLSEIERVPGTIYAFGHEADRDMSHGNPGRTRIQLYRFAQRDPRLMKELVKRWR